MLLTPFKAGKFKLKSRFIGSKNKTCFIIYYLPHYTPSFNVCYTYSIKLLSYLIFPFEYKHVGDFAERNAQMYNFSLGDFVGYVAYVYHSGRLVVGSFV